MRIALSSSLPLLAASALIGCKSDTDLLAQRTTDTFQQAANNQVDILWVIDNSNSMTEEQATLERGFVDFASQLEASRTDFHIGVISTSFDYDDPDRGILMGEPAFLTPEDDYVNLFAERATIGTSGSDKEKGLEAAVYALQPTMTIEGGPNEGFVRPDAQLLVVIVSDEEDCSDGGVLEGQGADACYSDKELLPPVTRYITSLRNLKDSDDQVQVGAIVGTHTSACPEAYPGDRYMTVAALTGGLIGDICQADWANMLGDLGLNATGIRTRFQLSFAAEPDSVQVFVDETEMVQDPVNGWTYDEATWFVSFHEVVPERGSVITVSYTVRPGVSEPQVEPTATDEETP